MKILTKTVTTTMEVVAVPIKGTTKFVYVYSRFPAEEDNNAEWRYVMTKKDFDKATSPNDLQHYRFKMPHQKKTKYDSWYTVLSASGYAAIKNGEHDWYDKKHEFKLKFGQELPDDAVIVGYASADYKFTNLDGTYINRAIRDSYLDRYYDIRQIVKDRADLKDIEVLPEHEYHTDGRDPIYFVPGNGATVGLSIKLTDEQYAEYVMLEYYEKSKYLDEHTSLGKYKRLKELSYYDEDDEL